MSFSQFFAILLARKWIILFTLLMTVLATALITSVLPKTYTATAAVLVDYKKPDPVSGMVTPGNILMTEYVATQVDIIASHKVALKVVDSLRLADNPSVVTENLGENGGSNRDQIADYLLKHLEVKPSRESSVIYVHYSARYPEAAAALANAFANAYLKTNLELKVQPARTTVAWFDQQLEGLRNKLEQAQKKLSAYQFEKGIITVDENLDVETARLAELSNQLVSAQAQSYDRVSRKNQMEVNGKANDALPEVMDNAVIQRLKSELTQAEGKLAELSEKLGVNHPHLQSAQAEVNSIRKKLDAETSRVTREITHNSQLSQTRESSLRGALAAQKEKIMKLKRQRDEVALFSQEVENAQKAYDAAMQRVAQIRLESESTQGGAVVLNPAIPADAPVKPKFIVNVAVSFVVGMLLGIALAFLIELSDRRVRSIEDVNGAVGLPVVGILMKGPKKPRRWLKSTNGLLPLRVEGMTGGVR